MKNTFLKNNYIVRKVTSHFLKQNKKLFASKCCIYTSVTQSSFWTIPLWKCIYSVRLRYTIYVSRSYFVIWWNLLHLIQPSFDHLPRWSLSKPITPSTITQVYIYSPLCSFVSCLQTLSTPLYIFTFSPLFYLFPQLRKCRKTQKIFSQNKFFIE